MGAISIGTSTGLYGAPLATIRRSIRTRSTASMPLTLCLANFFNSVCWVVYAVIIVVVWVLLRNAFGCVLTTIQIILYIIYPTSTMRLQSFMIDHPDEASISFVFSTLEGPLGRKSSLDLKDILDFVAVRSPVRLQQTTVA
ncbi:hypothetical protein L915_02918 [Phytophthora nicotianae]|uniref:Sugar transporter SWEET1 n=1 Tax=Phytophthora nicotianae TaxID=4792 RepID=W2HHD1_PHYNI|nr:hypothetical protein L915_02918 [Phytophthora nicotianae]